MPDTATARLGLVAPLGTDPINQGDDTMRALVARLDAVLAPASSGPLSARPPSSPGTPGIVDRRYYATDIGLYFHDTGTGWVPVGIPIGGTIGWVAAGDLTPEIVLADGRTLSSSAYPTLDARIGAAASSPNTHLWNGGASPGAGLFRIPDYRGNVRVGPDNMGTARGAASRIPNSSRALGQSSGEDRHTQTGAEVGQHAHPVLVTHGWTTSGSFNQTIAEAYDSNAGTLTVPASVGALQQTSAPTPMNNMQPYAVENVLVRIL
jgi:microcystin-dependent protein